MAYHSSLVHTSDTALKATGVLQHKFMELEQQPPRVPLIFQALPHCCILAMLYGMTLILHTEPFCKNPDALLFHGMHL